MKNVGLQIGNSTGIEPRIFSFVEDQAWTLVKENMTFNWSIRGYLLFRRGDLVCLLDWFDISTCLYTCLSYMITSLPTHFSMIHNHFCLVRTPMVCYFTHVLYMTGYCMTLPSSTWLSATCLCGTHLYPLISKSLALVGLISLVLVLYVRLVTLWLYFNQASG